MSLIEKMRDVVTLGDKYPVYKNADIEIVEMGADEVKPTSKYVLRENLRRLNRVNHGTDIFNLEDVTELDENHVIAPPVVEQDGDNNLIVDGLHRFTIAKIKGKKIKAIFVRNADKERPVIGKPVAWEDVKIRRSKPEIASECRDLRVDDNPETIRKHYRDLSILGSLGRRPRNGQNG